MKINENLIKIKHVEWTNDNNKPIKIYPGDIQIMLIFKRLRMNKFYQ